jgi:hypothetical protein
MSTKPNSLLKAKHASSQSHNPDIGALVGRVQAEDEVPFQVKLPESLATTVKIFCATNKTTHKEFVKAALEAHLKAQS